MNKKNIILSSLFSLFVVACNSDNLPKTENNNSLLSVNLKSEITHNSTRNITSDDDSKFNSYKELGNYTVELKKNTGETVLSKKYSELELSSRVSAGSYSLKVFMGEDVVAGFDKLYMEGIKTFDIMEGEKKTVDCVCVPANARIKVNFSNDFFTYYSDCVVGVKTKYMNEPFNISKSDAGKDLFLKAGNNDEMTITFALKDKNGMAVYPKGFSEQKKNISKRDFIKIGVRPKIVNVEGGKVEGISVIISSDVEEEVIDVIIPDEYVSEP